MRAAEGMTRCLDKIRTSPIKEKRHLRAVT